MFFSNSARQLEVPLQPALPYTYTGWGNQDKQNTAPLNKPYYDTNTALLPSFTLSMHMYAKTH